MNSEPRQGVVPADRHDPLEDAYRSMERTERLADVFSWAAIVAFCVYVASHVQHHPLDGPAKFAFVATAVVAICLTLCVRYGVQPEVDRERLAMLLSDAFGVPYSPRPSCGYYTAAAAPSLRRLLMALAENTYFYPRLLARDAMLPLALVLLMTAGLVVALRYGTAEVVELFAIVLLFSDLGLPRLVRVRWMIREYKALHDEVMRVLGFGVPYAAPLEVEAMRLLAQYESVKSRGGIRARDSTFHKLNPRLTAEWAQILEKFETNAKA